MVSNWIISQERRKFGVGFSGRKVQWIIHSVPSSGFWVHVLYYGGPGLHQIFLDTMDSRIITSYTGKPKIKPPIQDL